MREWNFEIVGTEPLTQRMLRVVLTAADIHEFTYKPGQALRFNVLLPDGAFGRRDYTIRYLDRDTGMAAVDVFLHGDTPGPTWAMTARPGDRITAAGPRSRMYIQPDRDWHILSGDETCIPAICHILESAPPGTRAVAVIETGSADEHLAPALPDGVSMEWLLRPTGADVRSALPDWLDQFDFPGGHGHAYLIGETSVVRRQRQMLLKRGMPKTDISAEGYWRPGRVGGNDLINDE